MKKTSTLFLKLVLLFIGAATLVWLLYFPQIEGRNADADLYTIYFKDAFLLYAYIASIPFFIGLYQAGKLLNYIEENKGFSKSAIKAMKNIKYCAGVSIAFILGSFVFILLNEEEDKAGGLAICIYMALVSIIIVSVAAVLQKFLESGSDLKSENDLTV